MQLLVRNEANAERIARVALGVALIGAFFFVSAPGSYVALVVSGVMLATGALGSCPIYRIFGIKTCKDC